MSAGTKTGGREATNGVIPGRIALSVGRSDLPEPEGFRWHRLSDLARLESGHTPARSRSEYWDGDIPWIGIRDATGNHGRVIHDTLDSVTQAGLDNSSARLLPAGTVCLSRTASVGFVVQMGSPMATSQDFVNWVCGPELNGAYLRYVLMLEQSSVRDRFARGSTHQTMYYPEAKALNILVPTRKRQSDIAEVIGAIDDKIATNDRLRRYALALAQANFERDRYGVGVENVTLGDVSARGWLSLGDGYRTKSSEQGQPGLRILRAGDVQSDRVDPSGHDFVSAAHTRAIGGKASQSGDVVVTTKGTVGRVAVIPEGMEQVVYSPQLCYFRVINDDYLARGFVSGWFRSADFAAQAEMRMFKSDMAPYINLNDVRSMMIPVPTSLAEQRRIGEVQTALEKVAHAADAENGALTAVRDELLPLLMSGKVRVRDAEKVVEEVV